MNSSTPPTGAFDQRGQRVKTQTNIVNIGDDAYDVRGHENPYLGLKAFTYAERNGYAGREEEIACACTLLTAPTNPRSLFFITGVSGSGKSSFVQAGLLPALEQHYQQPGYLTQWSIFRPGEQPMVALAHALSVLEVAPVGCFAPVARYQPAPETNSTPARKISLLLIDQFEELFNQSEPTQREEFIGLLSNLSPFSTLHMHIIVTLRVDYLPNLFTYQLLYEQAKAGLDLRAMAAKQLETAIQRPLQARYPNTEKRWQSVLLNQLAKDAAEDAAYLPLLQVTLEEIWHGGLLTRDHYSTLTNAIIRRADTALTETRDIDGRPVPRSSEEQEMIRQIFLDLVHVTYDDNPRLDVRRTRPLIELTRSQPSVELLVRELATKRLLTIDEKLLKTYDQPVLMVDIIHESLIRNWTWLNNVIQNHRERLQQRRRFEEHRDDWQTHDRSPDYLLTGVYLAEAKDLQWLGDVALQSPSAKNYLAKSINQSERKHRVELERQSKLTEEQAKRAEAEAKRARTFRWAAVTVTFLLFFACSATVWALNRQQAAQTNAANAQSRALAATSQSLAATDPMRAWLLAIEAGRIADTDQAFTALNSQDQTLGKPLLTLTHDSSVNGTQWNRDETRILTWSGDSPIYAGDVRIWDAATGDRLLTLTHKSWVNGAQWDTNETRILSWSNQPVDTAVNSLNYTGTVYIWDATNGDLLHTLIHQSEVTGAEWNIDGTRILTWSGDKFSGEPSNDFRNSTSKVCIWDAETGAVLLTLTTEGVIWDAQWNATGTRILTLGSRQLDLKGESLNFASGLVMLDYSDTTISIWDASTGDLLQTHNDWGSNAQWNVDGTRILSWETDTIRIWDAVNGTLLRTLVDKGEVTSAQWNSTEARILSWGRDIDNASSTSDNDSHYIHIWNAVTGDLLHTFTHESEIKGAKWNADETKILSWGHDGTVRVWDAITGDLLLTLKHDHWVEGANWNAAGNRILSWGDDYTAIVWNTTSDDLLPTLRNDHWVEGADWNAAETRILAWSYDELDNSGDIRVWDAITSNSLLTITGIGIVLGAQWSADESRILSWSEDTQKHKSQVCVWNATTGDLFLSLDREGTTYGAAWNVAETRILSWGGDFSTGDAYIWDAVTGNVLLKLAHDNFVWGAQWNTDETRILTWTDDSLSVTPDGLYVWDAANGKLLLTFTYNDGVAGAKWSANEALILSWSNDGTIRVWDVVSGNLLLTRTHNDSVNGARWNADETRILSWDLDGTVRVWDAINGDLLLTGTLEGWANDAQWNVDETSILSWDNNGTAYLWDAQTGLRLRTFDGGYSNVRSAQWNRTETQVMLTTTDGYIYRYYTHMSDLLTAACTRATRNLTWAEWQQYLPGEPYRPTCPNLPIHPSVPPEMLATPLPTAP